MVLRSYRIVEHDVRAAIREMGMSDEERAKRLLRRERALERLVIRFTRNGDYFKRPVAERELYKTKARIGRLPDHVKPDISVPYYLRRRPKLIDT